MTRYLESDTALGLAGAILYLSLCYVAWAIGI